MTDYPQRRHDDGSLSLPDRLERIDTTLQNQEKRLRAIEGRINFIAGIGAVLIIALGVVEPVLNMLR